MLKRIPRKTEIASSDQQHCWPVEEENDARAKSPKQQTFSLTKAGLQKKFMSLLAICRSHYDINTG